MMMQNPAQLQAALQRVPDQYLMKEMQQPSGNVPQFLVMAELQRRRRMRAASQAQQANPAPESVAAETMEGVAALPAENMANLKGGGVVGYEGGGTVSEKEKKKKEKSYSERLQEQEQRPWYRFGPENTFLTPERVEASRKAVVGASPQMPNARQILQERGVKGLLGDTATNLGNTAGKIGEFITDFKFVPPNLRPDTVLPSRETVGRVWEGEQYVPPNARDELLARGEKTGVIDVPTPAQAAQTTPAAQAQAETEAQMRKRLGLDGVGPNQPDGGGGGGMRVGVRGPVGIGGLPSAKGFELDQSLFKKPVTDVPTHIANVLAARQQAGVTGEAGEEYMNYLRQKMGDPEAQKRQDRGNAMMQAGFAMMAGDSPYFFQNVGRGAQVGLQQYNERRDKAEKEEAARMGQIAQIEAQRRGEKVTLGDAAYSQKVAAEDANRQGMIEHAKLGQEAKLKLAEIESRLQAAQMAANAAVQAASIRGAQMSEDARKMQIHQVMVGFEAVKKEIMKQMADPMMAANPDAKKVLDQQLRTAERERDLALAAYDNRLLGNYGLSTLIINSVDQTRKSMYDPTITPNPPR